MMQNRIQLEALGFRVIATTKHEDGVSFDAHFVAGKRFMVHGETMPDEDLAMTALFSACKERV